MIDRGELVDWYRQNRDRSRGLFDLIEPSAYYTRPIALRNPIVFYEGHLPAFSLISLVKRGLGKGGVNERLEQLFARGIDPDIGIDCRPAQRRIHHLALARRSAGVRCARRRAGRRCARSAAAFDFEGRAHPAMRRGEAIYTALEHEAMHQETLLYMWHRLSHEHKQKPAGPSYEVGDAPPTYGVARIPAGKATPRLCTRRGAVWLGQRVRRRTTFRSPAFEVDLHSVTNADFLSFVEAGGYSKRALWSDEGWAWIQQERVQQPGVLGARRQSMVLARHVRESAAAPGLAGVREPGGSIRVCGAGKAAACRQNRSITAPRCVAGWRASDCFPGAVTSPIPSAGTSTSRAGSRCLPVRGPRERAPGACTT